MKRIISIIILVLAFASSASAMVLAGVLSKATGVTYAPNAPTGVTATPGDAQNTLTWTNSVQDSTHSPASSYDLLWGTSAGSEPNTITGVASPYNHTGRTNGTAYYYKVRANNGAGSATSSEVSGTPVALPSALAQYKFNGNVTDASGNGYNATVNGTAPTYTTGQDSVASHALIPVNDAITPTNYIGGINAVVYNQFYGTTAFTVSAWVKTSDAGGSQSGVILGLGGSATNPDNWSFQIYGHTSGGGIADQIGIRHEVSGGSSNQFCITSGATVANNAWHHLAFVVTTGQTGKVYLDGTELTARTGSYNDTFTAATATSGTKYVTLGALLTNASGSMTKLNPFLGSLDDVRVYSSALSSSQISAIYAAGAQ